MKRHIPVCTDPDYDPENPPDYSFYKPAKPPLDETPDLVMFGIYLGAIIMGAFLLGSLA
jgi:hypothetical protein